MRGPQGRTSVQRRSAPDFAGELTGRAFRPAPLAGSHATLTLSEPTDTFTVVYSMYSLSGFAKSYTNELDDLTITVTE